MIDYFLSSDWDQFIAWEKDGQKCIKVMPCYVDIAGDLAAGVLLSQIVYWHLPKKGGGSRLTIQHEMRMWLAKRREDWWDECRLTPRQVDRALDILRKKGLVEVRNFHFAGKPTLHISINISVFLDYLSHVLSHKMVKYEKANYRLVNDQDEQLQITDELITNDESVSYIYSENTHIDNGQRVCNAHAQTSSSSSPKKSEVGEITPKPLTSLQVRLLEMFDMCAAEYPKGVPLNYWKLSVTKSRTPICNESDFYRAYRPLERKGIIERCGFHMKGTLKLAVFRRVSST